jgi:hypothetical protein
MSGRVGWFWLRNPHLARLGCRRTSQDVEQGTTRFRMSQDHREVGRVHGGLPQHGGRHRVTSPYWPARRPCPRRPSERSWVAAPILVATVVVGLLAVCTLGRATSGAAFIGLSQNATSTFGSGTWGNDTLWDTSTVPAVTDPSDSNALQVGVKFRPKSNGQIEKVQFYKGPVNSGVHVGQLWTANGDLLASVNFTGETATGWQSATFATPVAVTAYNVYVVTVYMPDGGYAVDSHYFDDAQDRPQLIAQEDGATGCTGLYKYTSAGNFPATCFNSANYWVDVTFNTTAVARTGPIWQQYSGSNRNGGGTSTTVSLPEATTAGNQLLIMIESDSVVNTPAGFTLDRSQVNSGAQYVFRKATSAGETSWTVTAPVSAHFGWWAAEVTGLQASPLDVAASNGQTTKVGTWTTPTITPTAGNRLLIASDGRQAHDANYDAFGYTNSFVKIGEATSKYGSTDAGLSVAIRTVAANGSTGYSTSTDVDNSSPTAIIASYKLP